MCWSRTYYRSPCDHDRNPWTHVIARGCPRPQKGFGRGWPPSKNPNLCIQANIISIIVNMTNSLPVYIPEFVSSTSGSVLIFSKVRPRSVFGPTPNPFPRVTNPSVLDNFCTQGCTDWRTLCVQDFPSTTPFHFSPSITLNFTSVVNSTNYH